MKNCIKGLLKHFVRHSQEASKIRTFQETWNHVYADLSLETELSKLQTDEYLDELKSLTLRLPAKAYILEAGCGSGRWVFYLNEQGFRTIGVDIAIRPLKVAMQYGKKQRKPVELVLADVGHLPFRDSVFNCILSLGVIEHFEEVNRTRTVRSSYRCLKPWGMLFCSVPNKFHVAEVLLRLYHRMRGDWKWGVESSLTTKYLTNLLATQDFSVIATKTFGFKVAAIQMVIFFPTLWFTVLVKRTQPAVNKVLTRLGRFLKIFGFFVCAIGIKTPNPRLSPRATDSCIKLNSLT